MKSFKQSFLKTFREYIKNSLIPGYHYLIGRNYYERFCWGVLYLLHIGLIVFLTIYTWNRFFTSPLITWQDSFRYPITNVPFPGVSICNINKISKEPARKFAKILANSSKIPYEEILNSLSELGRLYDYSIDLNIGIENLKQLQKLLEDNEIEKMKPFDTYRVVDRLSESCDDMLKDCHWKGAKYNCRELFVKELTMDGNCCVFNYAKKGKHSKILEENKGEPLKTGAGQINGLKVKLITNLSNYMYTTMSTLGMKIIISKAGDFPDTSSGGVQEILAPINKAISLKINSKTLKTAKEVRKYGIDKRKCYFSDEQKTIFGDYSYSDCIMDCKIRSIAALCQCIPFMYNFVINNLNFYQCTLTDLPCLNKFKAKWETIYPDGYEGESLEGEKQESLLCNNCVPACSDTTYDVRNDVANYINNNNKENLNNYTLLNVYYPDPYGELLKQDVIYYWFEMIGLFGGLFSLIMGVSVITIVEIIYFFTIRLYFNYNNTDE